MYLIDIESTVSNEWYSFLVAAENDDYWYSRSGVQFPKAYFTVRGKSGRGGERD